MKRNRKSLIKQLFFFGIVGVICFFVDFGILTLLTEVAGLHYLLSAAISFSVSCIVNYFLSMKLVFVRKEELKRSLEFFLFVLFSVLGLGLTVLLMWLGTDIMGINYKICKVLSTIIVMVFNFVTKKLTISRK